MGRILSAIHVTWYHSDGYVVHCVTVRAHEHQPVFL